MTAIAAPPAVPATDLGVLAGLVGYHLRRASVAFGVDFARALGHTGIRQGLFGILSVVAANPGLGQGAVGRALGIQRANMVVLVNELVALNLVERNASLGDRRVAALRLTETGVATLESCVALVRDHERRLLAALDPAERRSLIALLEKSVTVGD